LQIHGIEFVKYGKAEKQFSVEKMLVEYRNISVTEMLDMFKDLTDEDEIFQLA
jgi:hypothetical protein